MVSMVMAGDYKGAGIKAGFNSVTICHGLKRIKIGRNSVESYELITDEHRKSAASGIGRGIVGGALLGPVGMLGGALSAKNKSVYQVVVQFRDGKKSLMQLDGPTYKALVTAIF